MLSLQDCRAALGPGAEGLSDAQVEALRAVYYQRARAVVSHYRALQRPADDVGLQRVDQPRPLRRRAVRRSA